MKLLERLLSNGKDRRIAEDLAKYEIKFIKDLKATRESRGLSIEKVAETLGMKPAYVVDLESLGFNPTLSELRYYMLAIGVSFRHQIVQFD